MSLLVEADQLGTRPDFQTIRRFFVVHGVRHTLRLTRFASGWVASADTISGPTVGADRSPYLAARRALEPLGVGLVEAMTLIGPVEKA